MLEIRHCVTRAGKDVFDDWLSQLADARAQARIVTRVNRLSRGNFGDCKRLRQGLCELRIDWGPGYRVYYAMLADFVSCYSVAATNENSLRMSTGRWSI